MCEISLWNSVLQENIGDFDFSADYAYQNELHGLEGRPSSSEGQRQHYGPQWALLKFSQPVTAPKVWNPGKQSVFHINFITNRFMCMHAHDQSCL